MHTLVFSDTLSRYFRFPALLLLFLGSVSLTQAQDTSSTGQQVFAPGDTLYVKEMILTHQVINRQPADTVASFQYSDGKAWCFARIYNSGAKRQLHFVWYLENEAYFTFPATIGTSPSWRTYSNVTLQAGRWHVKLQTENGQVLAEKSFMVEDNS